MLRIVKENKVSHFISFDDMDMIVLSVDPTPLENEPDPSNSKTICAIPIYKILFLYNHPSRLVFTFGTFRKASEREKEREKKKASKYKRECEKEGIETIMISILTKPLSFFLFLTFFECFFPLSIRVFRE